MADVDEFLSDESAGISEVDLSDLQESEIDESSTPSGTRASAPRCLFSCGSAATLPLLSSNKENAVGQKCGGGSGGAPVTTDDTRKAASNDTQLLILQEVKKANSRLDGFADCLEALESRLASVETKQMSVTPASTSTESSTDCRKKRKVPAKVRVSFFFNTC